ncbi:type II secretory pathway [Striga asiatica]|uniref:Type II secretory pathway n=1 Tax=Striga asiatica TaxID=4170 RepID=A0A5A7RIV7_STRAF|nr:type II secretory pathway [Striga asiatica]
MGAHNLSYSREWRNRIGESSFEGRESSYSIVPTILRFGASLLSLSSQWRLTSAVSRYDWSMLAAVFLSGPQLEFHFWSSRLAFINDVGVGAKETKGRKENVRARSRGRCEHSSEKGVIPYPSRSPNSIRARKRTSQFSTSSLTQQTFRSEPLWRA